VGTRLRTGALLLAVVIGGVLAPMPTSYAGGGGGSLDLGNSISGSVPMRAGITFTYGLSFLSNRTDSPLTLKKVQLVRHSQGLRLLHTRVVSNRLAGGVAVALRWPPPNIGDLVPVRGFVLQPHEQSVEVVLGIHVRAGRQTFSRIRVVFEGPNGKETGVLPQAFAACAIPKGEHLFAKPCPAPPPPNRR
jgi:hypothetical protein